MPCGAAWFVQPTGIRSGSGDSFWQVAYVFLTRRSGFIQEGILVKVERRAHGDAGSYPVLATGRSLQVDVAARMREMWE